MIFEDDPWESQQQKIEFKLMLCYLFANSLVWSMTSYICNSFSLTNTFPPKVEKSCQHMWNCPEVETQTNRACGARRLCFPIGPIALRRRQAKVRNWIRQTESTSEHRVPGFSKSKQRLVFQSFYSQSNLKHQIIVFIHVTDKKKKGFDVVFLFQQLCHVFIWISRTVPHMLQCRGTSTTVFHSFSVKEIDKEGFWGKLELIFSQWTFGGKDDFTAGRGGPSAGQWTWRWWWSWWCTRWGLWIVMHTSKNKNICKIVF